MNLHVIAQIKSLNWQNIGHVTGFCWTKAGQGDVIMIPLLSQKPKVQDLNFLNEGEIKVI